MKVYMIIGNEEGLTQDPMFASIDKQSAVNFIRRSYSGYIKEVTHLSLEILKTLDFETIEAMYRDLNEHEESYIALYETELDVPWREELIEINRDSIDEINPAENPEIADGEELMPNVGHLIAKYIDLNYVRETIGVRDFMALMSDLMTAFNFGRINTAFDKVGLKPPVVGDKVTIRPARY